MRPLMNTALAALAATCLALPAAAQTAGDSVNDPSLFQETRVATTRAFVATRDGLSDAAMSPLEDLNLRREDIPPLLATFETPYDAVGPMTCRNIERQVSALTELLSADYDEVRAERGRAQRAGDSAGDAVLGAVASEARGFIPFRGVVRRVTGAHSHDQGVREAYEIGYQRRSFLKGIGLTLGCDAPAAPAPMIKDAPVAITFKGTDPNAFKDAH